MVGRGQVWIGAERLGKAVRGKASPRVVWHGKVWFGAAVHGEVRRGPDRQGAAWRGVGSFFKSVERG